MNEHAHFEAVAEEKRRLRRMRAIVDLTTNLIAQSRMTRSEAEHLVAAARERILELFPDKAATYDIVLAPRFHRLMNEYAGPPQVRGRVLQFRRHHG